MTPKRTEQVECAVRMVFRMMSAGMQCTKAITYSARYYCIPRDEVSAAHRGTS